MKATRHNGRSGKHGTYDAKHNDRRFDVENIDSSTERNAVRGFLAAFFESTLII